MASSKKPVYPHSVWLLRSLGLLFACWPPTATVAALSSGERVVRQALESEEYFDAYSDELFVVYSDFLMPPNEPRWLLQGVSTGRRSCLDHVTVDSINNRLVCAHCMLPVCACRD